MTERSVACARRVGVAATLILYAACAADAPDERATGAIVRDSAGVRIVENAGPALPAGAWSVGGAPLLEIGATDDEAQLLYYVGGAVRLDDGRVVVAQAGTPTLRWFDEDGRLVAAAGRPGGGPGEFGGEGGAVFALWRLPGDSVATWEHSERRMQVFDPAGRFARAVTLELPPGMPTLSYPQIGGRTEGAFFTVTLDQPPYDGITGQVRRDIVHLDRYTPDGRHTGEIGRSADFVNIVLELERGGRTFRTLTRPLFGSFPAWTASADRFYYSGSERFDIAVYDATGALVQRIRRVQDDVAVTDAMVDAYHDARLAAATTPEARAMVQRNRMPAAERLPAHGRLLADRTGQLWVRNYGMPGEESATQTWSVFDRDGRWVTDVATPTGWSIEEIGVDYILVIERTELDVEVLRMYPLTRQAGARSMWQ